MKGVKKTVVKNSEQFLSRGQRKRRANLEIIKQRKEALEQLSRAKKQRENVKVHGPALANLSAGFLDVVSTIGSEVTAADEDKQFRTLKVQLNKTTLTRKQQQADELAGLIELDERLSDPVFLADPLGYTLARLEETAKKRDILLSQYKDLKDTITRRSTASGKSTQSAKSVTKSIIRNIRK